jgi:hypothetical protein
MLFLPVSQPLLQHINEPLICKGCSISVPSEVLETAGRKALDLKCIPPIIPLNSAERVLDSFENSESSILSGG